MIGQLKVTTKLSKPWNEYPVWQQIAAKMCRDAAIRFYELAYYEPTNIETNPDWINPKLVDYLREVDAMASDFGGLTDPQVISAIINSWIHSGTELLYDVTYAQ